MVFYWNKYWISNINIAESQNKLTRLEILGLQGNIKTYWYIIHVTDTKPLVGVTTILACSWNNKHHSWLCPKQVFLKQKYQKVIQ